MDVKFLSILSKKKKNIFFLFYISISVYFTSSFYLNNIFLTFFLLFHTQSWPPTLTHKPTPFSMNTFPFFFFSHSSSFFSSFFFFIILSIHLSLSLFPIPSINLSQFTAPINQTQWKAESQINTKTKPTNSIINSNRPTKFPKLEHQFQQTHKSPPSLKPNKRKNLDCVDLDYGFW